ncbi:hypothetical protein SAMN02745121_01901 [Nannocystis exedens]|uniref:Rhodanese domain-containing protein n=1 Tax=Nannocystis exedens TaxID=54 RepID=A0A1I1VSB2_9BACT|nr:hypothetical protein [Nannocystis exedens]PCC72785.1 hypothetical protein NAEX_05870 [Nannocystis exedens]SFD85714.1 hypothetical protein SAMN02745121_01901 [Nannocystis exedens]
MTYSPRAALLSLLVAPLGLAACPPGDPSSTETAGVSESSTATTLTAGTTDTTGDGETTTATDTTLGTGDASTTTTTDPTTEALPTTGPTTEATTTTTDATTTTTTDATTTDTTTTETTGGNGLWDRPNLWYSVENHLVYIEIDPSDGAVVTLVDNEIVADEPLVHGQNGLTMLEDGSLIGSRESAEGTQIFHIPDPPFTENTPAQATLLGIVPNDGQDQPIRVEALYTDCDGRVYLMDTGEDVGNNEGNRLLRFTGAYLQGDLAFEVITDLGNASVADIDDMSPGIVDGEVSDSLGFAMDSSNLWQIDYTTGTGMQLADTDGTWGIHALGGPLFDDMQPRLYILSSGDDQTGAALMQVDLDDFSNSRPLVTGPDFDLDGGYNGWSGLAGPLTECMTTIPG